MRRILLLAVLAALALVAAGTAVAAPPTLLAAGQADGKAYATWSLPAAGQTWSIEVATSTAVDPNGYFAVANVVDADVFMSGVTTWGSQVVLDPGTYYLHVSAQDTSCTDCPVPEWSAVKAFTVPGGTGSGSDTSTGDSTGSGSSSTPTPTPSPTLTPQASTVDSGSTGVATPPSTAATTYQPTRTPEVPALWLARRGRLVRGTLWSCDDRAGLQHVQIVVSRGKEKTTTATTIRAVASGCHAYWVRVKAPTGASGRVTVTVRVRDAAGRWSLPATKRLG